MKSKKMKELRIDKPNKAFDKEYQEDKKLGDNNLIDDDME